MKLRFIKSPCCLCCLDLKFCSKDWTWQCKINEHLANVGRFIGMIHLRNVVVWQRSLARPFHVHIYGDAPCMPLTCYNLNEYMHNDFTFFETMLSMFGLISPILWGPFPNCTIFKVIHFVSVQSACQFHINCLFHLIFFVVIDSIWLVLKMENMLTFNICINK
jgi:hypothetical protein